MTKMSKKPELLAPAGNKESFMAVLRAGADAVYLAGNKYGARAYADNFSEEELCTCIRYAHIYNKRVYLTVNTLVTDSELDELYVFLSPMYEVGLDGVIVQDLGVISYIRKQFPDMEVHASTQINTTGLEGIDFLKNMGVCRVVPARELSLKEISSIKSSTDIELECFIHGAICYCYSGQCLFSSVIGSRSGNRGRCAQPCRLPYTCNGKNDIYPLSLKDMCTIDYLPKLIEAGIDSFKIEGRMKKPEYAAGVTALYRKYIDMYFSKGEVNVSEKDRKTLSSLYIRSQLSNGYYEKYNGADMITIDSPSYSGSDDNLINTIHDLYVGDYAKNQLDKIKIDISGYFVAGETAYVSVSYNDIYITKYGDIVDVAQKKPITAEDILKQINKLGSTVFTIDSEATKESIYVSDDAYYNLKGINELRRAAIAELEELLINSYGLIYSRSKSDRIESSNITSENNTCNNNTCNKRIYSILINDYKQLNSVLEYLNSTNRNEPEHNSINRIYIPEELIIDDTNTIINIISNSVDNTNNISNTDDKKPGIEYFIATPYVRRMRDNKLIDTIKQLLLSNSQFKGVLVRNIEDLNFFMRLKADHNNLKIAIDYGVYTWNSETAQFLSQNASSIGVPIELCGAAQREIAPKISCEYVEKMIYGRIPLMHSANCVNKTLGKCRKIGQGKNLTEWTNLTDRTRRDLPVYTDCTHCQNTIYNALPLTITKELKSYSLDFAFRIDFTNENSKQINDVLDFYLGNSDNVTWEYTKAFEKHSTE